MMSSLLRELRSWARFLLPSKYVAVYYPTPLHVARKMLQLADVSSKDVVYDLGCGDGRILVLAAEEFGACGVGVELDQNLAKAAELAIMSKGLQHRIRIQQGDARGLDVTDATVLTLYLSSSGNEELLKSVQSTLQQGTKIVSLHFRVDGWEQYLVKIDRSANIGIQLYCYRRQR